MLSLFPQTFVKAHHKVGVLRVKEGQRNEEDIFCNCHETGPFDEFLNVLGTEGFLFVTAGVCLGSKGCQ